MAAHYNFRVLAFFLIASADYVEVCEVDWRSEGLFEELLPIDGGEELVLLERCERDASLGNTFEEPLWAL